MKSILIACLAAAVFVAGCGKRTEENSGSAKTDAIPNYANWAA